MCDFAGKPILGQEGKLLFVNSAHGVSRDAVDENFPVECDALGRIPLALVHDELGVQVGETLVIGRVAIRRRIEDAGYSRAVANKVAPQLPHKEWRGIPWMRDTAIDSLVEARRDRAKAAHRAELEVARAKRREDFSK